MSLYVNICWTIPPRYGILYLASAVDDNAAAIYCILPAVSGVS